MLNYQRVSCHRWPFPTCWLMKGAPFLYHFDGEMFPFLIIRFDGHLTCGHRKADSIRFSWVLPLLADSNGWQIHTWLVKEPHPHGFVASNWSPWFFRMILSHVTCRSPRPSVEKNGLKRCVAGNDGMANPLLAGEAQRVKRIHHPQKWTIFYGYKPSK